MGIVAPKKVVLGETDCESVVERDWGKGRRHGREIVLEMVDGEEEEDMVDIVNE